MVEWELSGLFCFGNTNSVVAAEMPTAPPEDLGRGEAENYQSSTGKLAAQEEFSG
jgi:hypothetical protein